MFQNLSKKEYPKLLNEFRKYLYHIQGKSWNTVESYSYDIYQLLIFLLQYKGIGIDKVEEDNKILDISFIEEDFFDSLDLYDFYAYLNYCKSNLANKNATTSRKVSSIKAFFKFLHKKVKCIKTNPTEELEFPKIDRRLPIHLNQQDAQYLLDNITGRNKERNQCIVALFLNCGLRLSELCSLNLNSIRKDCIRVVGKGNKERIVYLNDVASAYLEKYLEIRNNIDTTSKALFLSERKTRICPRTVEHMVKRLIVKSGLNDEITPHKLRHTFATLLYKNGVDIRSIQALLGHEKLSTTQIYTHTDSEMLRDAVRNFPLKVNG